MVLIAVCPLTKADVRSLDFTVNRFFMKLFKTTNIAIVESCQAFFAFEIPSVLIREPENATKNS